MYANLIWLHPAWTLWVNTCCKVNKNPKQRDCLPTCVNSAPWITMFRGGAINHVKVTCVHLFSCNYNACWTMELWLDTKIVKGSRASTIKRNEGSFFFQSISLQFFPIIYNQWSDITCTSMHQLPWSWLRCPFKSFSNGNALKEDNLALSKMKFQASNHDWTFLCNLLVEDEWWTTERPCIITFMDILQNLSTMPSRLFGFPPQLLSFFLLWH